MSHDFICTRSKPYWGFATFAEYYAATNRPGWCNEKSTLEQAWQSVMDKINSGVHISSAEFIRKDRKINPNAKFGAVWYFLIPEARATIPADLLAEVDAAMDARS